MLLVETPVFTRQVLGVLTDDEYRQLQLALVFRPEQGVLVPSGQGLRKLRWPQPGRGKRGGLRVLYYWHRPSETVYLLFVYEKSQRGQLSPRQIRRLGSLIRKELA